MDLNFLLRNQDHLHQLKKLYQPFCFSVLRHLSNASWCRWAGAVEGMLCTAPRYSLLSGFALHFWRRWGVKPAWRFLQVPFACLLEAAVNAFWTSLVFFSPQWEPVVLLDWAKIASVSHATSEGHGKDFFHQKREASFSQSWETGTCLCPEKQTCWVERMLGLQLF